MSKEEIIERAMELPLRDRVLLAEELWQSVGPLTGVEIATDGVREAIETAKRRDFEMTSGRVEGLSHDAVMKSARHAIGCD
ncbi:MAG TPA: hypothetical protein VGS22_08295 [Thermoanaerobaculia bacterium]|jgi:putative addiction module component (TIGR02574 family)|nr:hypothetical protein [Thermoanaerobaculia bacterium]